MKITKIRLQEEHPMAGPGGTWPLPVCDLDVDLSAGMNGYVLKIADGLGPPDFLAIVEGFDSVGTPVFLSDPQTRDVAFKIGICPCYGKTNAELRDDLYKLISRTILIKLMDGSTVVAQAAGFIKTFDSAHFSSLPEVQMIVECQDGAFSAPAVVPIPLASITSALAVVPDHDVIINYEEGTAPAGLDLNLTVTAAQTGFSISEYAKFWAIGGVDIHNVFQVNYAFLAGDVITISTHPKRKKISLLRGAVTTDLAGYLNAGAVWPKLYTGVNAFKWNFTSSWMTWNTATYTPRFWGV
jgi:hypothetical protein